jgi:hypothetical protein
VVYDRSSSSTSSLMMHLNSLVSVARSDGSVVERSHCCSAAGGCSVRKIHHGIRGTHLIRGFLRGSMWMEEKVDEEEVAVPESMLAGTKGEQVDERQWTKQEICHYCDSFVRDSHSLQCYCRYLDELDLRNGRGLVEEL